MFYVGIQLLLLLLFVLFQAKAQKASVKILTRINRTMRVDKDIYMCDCMYVESQGRTDKGSKELRDLLEIVVVQRLCCEWSLWCGDLRIFESVRQKESYVWSNIRCPFIFWIDGWMIPVRCFSLRNDQEVSGKIYDYCCSPNLDCKFLPINISQDQRN